jgi:RND family efflux transporter MFP subunit
MNSKQIKSVDNPKAPSVLPHSPVKSSLAVVAVLALIIGSVVAGLIPRFRQQTEVGAETRGRSVPTVTVVSPKPGQPVTGLALPAEIKPWVEAPIYARASGYLKRRMVDIGSHVEGGQLLAEIDTPELNQELERARGQLAQAEAALGLSKITATRWAGLLKTASVSEQENAEKQADLKLKTATADSARAEVRRLEKLHSFSRVVAPFDGIVTVRNVDTGDLIVAAGSKEIFHLAQTQRLRVFVQVPQAMARGIGSGQSAELSLPELPGHSFTAKVIRTAGVMAADSRTLLVELEVDNSQGEILAGGYAQVRFTEAKMDALLTLPSNTLLFRADGPQIGVVHPDGTVEMRSVKIGRDFGQAVEIVAGVSSKDRVVVNPAESLVAGATVAIAETTQTEKKP